MGSIASSDGAVLSHASRADAVLPFLPFLPFAPWSLLSSLAFPLHLFDERLDVGRVELVGIFPFRRVFLWASRPS